MTNTIYRTRPRLFILGMTFLGFVFFGSLTWLIYSKNDGKLNILLWVIIFFFAILSLACLFYFLTIKIIKLKQDSVVISFLFLPIKRKLLLCEVRDITQSGKKVSALIGPSAFKPSYIYTDLITRIHLSDGTDIKINSIGELDFSNFEKLFTKLKRGEGKLRQPEAHFLLYLLDNLDGIIWMFLVLILTVGLAWYLCIR